MQGLIDWRELDTGLLSILFSILHSSKVEELVYFF